MLKQSRKKDSYVDKVNKAIELIKKEGYEDIRADIDKYDPPYQLKGKTSNVKFIPDITARKNDGKGYFEIAKKSKDTTNLVNKWKLLETLSEMKSGDFKIFVPHGNMKFTKELLTKYHINAEVVKI